MQHLERFSRNNARQKNVCNDEYLLIFIIGYLKKILFIDVEMKHEDEQERFDAAFNLA